MTLGEVIRKRRKERGLSLRGAARAIGISAVFLCDIEHGRRMPGPYTLECINATFKLKIKERECPSCHGEGRIFTV